MNDMLIRAAEAGGAEDMEAVAKIINEANRGQREVIEDLLDARLAVEEDFLGALSQSLRLPWEAEIKPRNSRRLKEVCSSQIALRHRLLPLWFGNPALQQVDENGDLTPEAHASMEAAGGEGPQVLALCTYDPFNFHGRQAVSQAIPWQIQWHMASRTRILHGIQKLYGVGADTFDAILRARDPNDTGAMDLNEETNVLDEDDEEASVVKFVNAIIRQALQQRGTDIHVEPMESSLRIRYRIDGLLVDVPVPENIKALQSMVIARLKIMSRLDIAERRLPQDGRIGLELDGKQIDVRVATVPTVLGESISLRLLNQQKFNLDKLGFMPEVRKVIDNLLKLPNGVVLITGPTGSGKSTSLYTFLSEINTIDSRIITVEDPVENKIEGVVQIAVKPEINLTFASALRSILRADPDTVMIGEMRDLETVEIAIRAALTGHLVFSTLHTNDAISGITRLVDMGVEPFLVAASVRAFLAQRLVRRLCQKCKQPHPMTAMELRAAGFSAARDNRTVYTAKHKGCDSCNHTGFYGRIAIYEVVVVSKTIEDLIVRRASESKIKEEAIREGFIPMRDYGFWKVLEGETTVEEVISVTANEMTLGEPD
ncbi:MAG: type II/IV secretion system protein [Verrucomicrobiaceae bacterium]|nr:MAG: type II/IV secretion system protein [Verrucomicrobiaceae bacterium]